MPKYKVKTIALAVKNNRIAKFGEFVDDSELTANPNDMINAGAIELVFESKKDKKAVLEVADAPELKIDVVTEYVSKNAFTDAPKAGEKQKAKGAASVIADSTAE